MIIYESLGLRFLLPNRISSDEDHGKTCFGLYRGRGKGSGGLDAVEGFEMREDIQGVSSDTQSGVA